MNSRPGQCPLPVPLISYQLEFLKMKKLRQLIKDAQDKGIDGGVLVRIITRIVRAKRPRGPQRRLYAIPEHSRYTRVDSPRG